MAKIGVEKSLTDISSALRERGHEVVDLQKDTDAKDCSCCVISGMDSNIMGMQDTYTTASVVAAHGLSAEEVCQKVEDKLH
ncbi:YkuS family protein [Bacillus sp. 03113]|uniref:YkuS family protein n=1 Tax=Bacillus sp. 03113 TaxID=2578211 RepID=UPI0011445541|nr:YkuS family protein [Bacillus sp. 03113]